MPKAIPPDKVLRLLNEYIQKTGHIPTRRELRKVGLPSDRTYDKYFRTYNKALESLGYEPNQKRYKKDELIKILHNYVKENGKVPYKEDFENDPTLPSAITYVNHFGNWTKALLKAGLRPNRIDHEFDELLQTYKNDRKKRLSLNTIRIYLISLQDLSNFLKSKEKTWNDLTLDEIVDYFSYLKQYGSFSKLTKDAKPNTPNGLRAKARIISAFLSWLDKYALRKKLKPIIDSSEIAEIKEVMQSRNIVGYPEETPRRALTNEEIDVIRSIITNPIERNIFDLGLNLGLRVSEYEQITMDMVLGMEDERRPHLNVSESIPRYKREHYIEVIGKGNKKRIVVVTDEMKLLIKKQLVLRELNRVKHDRFFFSVGKKTIGRLQNYKVNELYKDLSEETGIYFRAHELRYSMAELFQERGVPQNIVSQRLGHSGGITQRYSRAKPIKRYKIIQEKIGVL